MASSSLSSQLVSSSPNWCVALKQFSPHTRPDVPLRLIDRITGGTGPDFIFILGLGYILTSQSVYSAISIISIISTFDTFLRRTGPAIS